MDLEELNRRIQAEVDLRNNKPLEDFHGRSPQEMEYLFHMPYHMDSPMQIIDEIDEGILLKVPIVEIALCLMKTIDESSGIKLTANGNLPLKVVKQLYDLRNFPSELIDSGQFKITSEADLFHIHAVRLVMEIAGLTRKQKGKLLVTKYGKKHLLAENMTPLFIELFQAYTMGYNWAFNDGYENNIGQPGFAFSLDMVNKFGDELLPVDFYALSYSKAFPMLADEVEEIMYMSKEEIIIDTYQNRTFYYFMRLFGLIETVDKGVGIEKQRFVKKSEMFNWLLRFD